MPYYNGSKRIGKNGTQYRAEMLYEWGATTIKCHIPANGLRTLETLGGDINYVNGIE